MATNRHPLLTQHIVISKGEDGGLFYGWWYLNAPFSLVVGSTKAGVLTVDEMAAHIKEEWPDVTIHKQQTTKLEAKPEIADDEDMSGFEEDKITLRTMLRTLVKEDKANS